MIRPVIGRPVIRRARPQIDVGPGERVLAWAVAADGVTVAGTRDAAYLPVRVPWEQVEAVSYDADTSTLRISEVGTWGEQRPEHSFVIEEPGRFLELVRERVRPDEQRLELGVDDEGVRHGDRPADAADAVVGDDLDEDGGHAVLAL